MYADDVNILGWRLCTKGKRRKAWKIFSKDFENKWMLTQLNTWSCLDTITQRKNHRIQGFYESIYIFQSISI